MDVKSLSSQDKKKLKYSYIRALMALCGVKGIDIAKQCKVSNAMVSKVVHGKDKSRRIQVAIARALKTPFDELWPG